MLFKWDDFPTAVIEFVAEFQNSGHVIRTGTDVSTISFSASGDVSKTIQLKVQPAELPPLSGELS